MIVSCRHGADNLVRLLITSSVQLTCVLPKGGSNSEKWKCCHTGDIVFLTPAPRITGVLARGRFGFHAYAAFALVIFVVFEILVVFLVVVAVVVVVVGGGSCNTGVVYARWASEVERQEVSSTTVM